MPFLGQSSAQHSTTKFRSKLSSFQQHSIAKNSTTRLNLTVQHQSILYFSSTIKWSTGNSSLVQFNFCNSQKQWSSVHYTRGVWWNLQKFGGDDGCFDYENMKLLQLDMHIETFLNLNCSLALSKKCEQPDNVNEKLWYL